jgi:hypothetical protein
MPYHSPHNGDRRGGGDHRGGWDRGGRDRDHWRDRDRNHLLFYGWAGYPYWPWWGWGYPYLNGYWNSYDDYDAQPGSDYTASQYPQYDPNQYEDPQRAQPEPEQPSSSPWPYNQPAPANPQPATAAGSEIPATTLVFKDGRPNEQVRNYLMTAKTLTILDRNHRDIPVDQIDLAATEKVNRETGIEFAIPGGGR